MQLFKLFENKNYKTKGFQRKKTFAKNCEISRKFSFVFYKKFYEISNLTKKIEYDAEFREKNMRKFCINLFCGKMQNYKKQKMQNFLKKPNFFVAISRFFSTNGMRKISKFSAKKMFAKNAKLSRNDFPISLETILKTSLDLSLIHI